MTTNQKTVDLLIEKKDYVLFHNGLQKLLKLFTDRRDYGIGIGLGEELFLEEIKRISGMIRYCETELSQENWSMVNLYGVSQESLAYLKSAALLEIETFKKEKESSGSGTIQKALDEKIRLIEKDINGGVFQGVEPPDAYYDILTPEKKNGQDRVVEKEYNILEGQFHYDANPKDRRNFKCLVIMPIGKKDTIEYKNNMLVFDRIIKPGVKNSGYNIECYHADLISESGDISKQVIEALKDDDIVIADLRRNNLNVIYELGIRHAFGKRSILICSAHSDNFFYTAGYRAIPYNIDGISNQDFYKKLTEYIDDIIQNPQKSDNPVSDALGNFENVKFKDEYFKPETSVGVGVNYTKLQMTQDFHKYSFIFEVENRTKKKFDDIIVELYFPFDYLEKKQWEYPHLRSSVPEDQPKYLCLLFSYSALTDNAKSLFLNGLLPGKKLKVFGEGGITNLIYEMDHHRWAERFKYDVRWKVYVNGGAPIEGSVPLNSIQYF